MLYSIAFRVPFETGCKSTTFMIEASFTLCLPYETKKGNTLKVLPI